MRRINRSLSTIPPINDDCWYFTKEGLSYSPSRTSGFGEEQELFYRRKSAKLISEISIKINLRDADITNTAILLMNRFYMRTPIKEDEYQYVAGAALLMACKTANKMKCLLTIAEGLIQFITRGPGENKTWREICEEIGFKIKEQALNFILTLGCNIKSDNTCASLRELSSVISDCNDEFLLKAFEVVKQSFLMTTLCLQYKSLDVAWACLCMTGKWSDFEIKDKPDGRVNVEVIEAIEREFIGSLNQNPEYLQGLINFCKQINNSPTPNQSDDSTPYHLSEHENESNKRKYSEVDSEMNDENDPKRINIYGPSYHL